MVETIYAEYTRMREGGMAVKTALNLLRDNIDSLTEKEKLIIARRLRDYEEQRGQAAPAAIATPEPDPRPSGLRRLAQQQQPAPAPAMEPEWVNCPHCGKSNQRHEVLCYACGHLLRSAHTENETQALAETNDLSYSNDFFGEDTVLVLRARTSGRTYEARPQRSDHEIVIGRSTPDSAVVPDIDLADQDGDKLGVSRLHLTLRYDERYHTISVFDMGSANGTYINGQRLHAHEVRVLRDTDELRLGRLVLGVAFRHPA